MPTRDYPANYRRATFTASGLTDEFFKRLDLDEVVEYGGDTSNIVGFIQLIEVGQDMINEYLASGGYAGYDQVANLPLGWYITRQDDNGLIWAMGYGGSAPENEASARADYAEALAVFDYYWDGQL